VVLEVTVADWRDIERAMRDGSTIYCGQCKKECEVEERDYGIGAYDYGAGMDIHSDISLESTCCDSGDLLLESELPEVVELELTPHESEGNCGWTESFEKFARFKALTRGKA
jgi:hypothetical protein